MNIKQFRLYLSQNYTNTRVISDITSRCKRVEKYEGDLDEHFVYDNGKTLLTKMNYSKEDANRQIEPHHSIPIKGKKGYQSIYEGTLSLYHALELYFDFKNKM
ncbi:hypothetical protein QN089_08855 [Kurthia sp. YJT4]|uniref:hypothetical protein n=1 Tax=Kurthia sp. YJT4 TaxID=3049086 RepID=UPI00254F1048|nr:hypothetical protein [Kurthia sp. YJT4]WIL37467.1 hypothetical protein QN089_08855 [Kurthia sp. YJT4]